MGKVERCVSAAVTFFSMLVEEIIETNKTLCVFARSPKGWIAELGLSVDAAWVGRSVDISSDPVIWVAIWFGGA